MFQRIEVSRAEALAMAEKGALASLGERPGQPSRFKLDIVQNIPEDEKITLYRNGDFTDLCAGPHVARTGNVGAFKLTHVSASAYYKGDEKNPQLQRIYGTAFKNKTQMDEYFAMLEEAKKRDHRKLGKELELFTFDEDVGPGLPLSGCRAARRSSKNWKSWPRRRSSPPGMSACGLRIWRGRICTSRAGICRITRTACFHRWNWSWKRKASRSRGRNSCNNSKQKFRELGLPLKLMKMRQKTYLI